MIDLLLPKLVFALYGMSLMEVSMNLKRAYFSGENTHLPLPQHIRPLLSDTVVDLVRFITRVMPSAKANCSSIGHANISPSGIWKKLLVVVLECSYYKVLHGM